MRCGYNLRGLRSDGNCPECGNVISASLRGDLLRFSDPQWLARLRLGASLKLWAIAIGILLGFAVGLAVSFLSLPIVLVQFATLVASAIGLWGTWCITSQEPRIALHEEPLTLRRFIRVCAITSAVGALLLIAQSAAPMPGVVLLVGTILGYAGYAAAYGELFYFRRFANRVPDPDLVKSTRRLIRVAPIYGVLMVLIIVVGRLAARTAPTGPAIGPTGAATPGTGAASAPAAPAITSTGFGVFALVGVCGGSLFILFLFLWYVRLLTKYKAKFTEAIAQASAPSLSSTANEPDPDQPLPS